MKGIEYNVVHAVVMVPTTVKYSEVDHCKHSYVASSRIMMRSMIASDFAYCHNFCSIPYISYDYLHGYYWILLDTVWFVLLHDK